MSQKKVKEVRLAILSECSFNEGCSGAEILAQIKLWVIRSLHSTVTYIHVWVELGARVDAMRSIGTVYDMSDSQISEESFITSRWPEMSSCLTRLHVFDYIIYTE